MLKILFFCLLLINGGLIAFQQGYLDDLFPSTREPTRLQQQLNPDKLTLLPVAGTAPAKSSASAPAPTAVADTAPASSPAADKAAAPASATAASTPAVAACTEVGVFEEADARKFEALLSALSLGDRMTRRPVLEGSRHIVYIPPLGSKDAADKKAGELKRMGVDDFFVIQDNSALQWGISLGVFKTEEAAKKHLADLNQKGVRSARIAAHGTPTGKVVFQLKGLDAAAQSNVQKIKEGFPAQSLRDCN